MLRNTPSLRHYLATLNATPTVHRTFVFSEYGRGFTYGTTRWSATSPPATPARRAT
jgi:hypothetical protein